MRGLEKNGAYDRLRLLTGEEGIELLRRTGVIIFGVGGVGSWCAEALVRSGIGRLTMVDADKVCPTNINRQVQATSRNTGLPKVEELAGRLREINPAAQIEARHELYRRGEAGRFRLDRYEYVIDAIDSLSAKVDLIISATEAGATVFTSLGAGNRMDPSLIRGGSLWDSKGCRLGKLVRKRLRRRGFDGNPRCVYSEEPAPGFATESGECESCVLETAGGKQRVNGSAVFVTGVFGFFLAGMVVRDIMERAQAARQEAPPALLP